MTAKTSFAQRINLTYLRKGILDKDRIILSQAITLMESTRPQDNKLAKELIDEILPFTGKSIRIGITGAPGVGKSTFIDVFGKYLTSLGKTVAVLTIDPTSQKTKGSILGDKTRMEELSKDTLAFIRPSAAGETLGGVGNATRESILLCEAAGYEVIIVETVGVGQSEVAVRSIVDFFLLLLLAGAGDELQGIKKGIMEMADGLVITKADEGNTGRTKQAVADFKNALHLYQPPESGWPPRVLPISSLAKTGIKETWEMIEAFIAHTTKNKFFKTQRDRQLLSWFHSALDFLIKNKILLRSKKSFSAIEKKVLTHKLSPTMAAAEMMKHIKG